MTESTYRFQETLIRLLKGCIKAWETWLREQKMRGSVVFDSGTSVSPGSDNHS